MNIEKPSLLIIDFQEKLFPAIEENWIARANTCFLIKSFKELGLPLFYTEQSPKKLGETISEIKELLEGVQKIEKTTFSCLACTDFRKFNIEGSVVICGIETHICVFQTVVDLLENGFKVMVAEDACGSRKKRLHEVAIDEMRQHGATIIPSESIVYLLLKDASRGEFGRILPFVKEKDKRITERT